MQIIITSGDFDEVDVDTHSLIYTWYDMVRRRGDVEQMIERELKREIRAAIESRTDLLPEQILIDFRQNDT